MTLSEDVAAELDDLAERGLLRPRTEQTVRGGRSDWIDVSSNDYLGLGRESVSRETLDVLAALPVGSGASRLIHGTHPAHRAVEQALASWVGHDAALLFSAGYAANVGVITGLTGAGDLIVSDALNHASTVDGCRLSRATIRVVPHRDLDRVEEALREPTLRRRWVVTESYFSMDGDSPDLRSLRRLCDRYDAGLIVDEAHALGTFGVRGSGLATQAEVRADVLVGTLGKAVGYQGAFVAAPATLIDMIWNRARTFVFSTAPSPVSAVLTLLQVQRVQEGDLLRSRLQGLVSSFEAAWRRVGGSLGPARHGPIFPVVIGSNEGARSAALALLEQGFLTQAIRPPTVPAGEARLRIALNARLRTEDVVRLAEALGELCRGLS